MRRLLAAGLVVTGLAVAVLVVFAAATGSLTSGYVWVLLAFVGGGGFFSGVNLTRAHALPPGASPRALPQETAPSRPLSAYHWLHLSDIHFGTRGRAEWTQLVDDFERDLLKRLPRIGAPIDLILISGDLTDRGTAEQFDGFGIFLDRLMALLERETKHRPLVIPVPGNHDLTRPSTPSDADAEPGEDFWGTQQPGRFAHLFHGYTSWLESAVLPSLREAPGVEVHRSFFPGDLTVILDDPKRFRLIIVGLNSAWKHDRDVEEGALALPTEQFHAALPPVPGGYNLDIFPKRGPPRALLMHHHPPSWLSPTHQEQYLRMIHDPARFTACLFGHMHVPTGSSVSSGGGSLRANFQAPSLFGIEHYGTAHQSRILGYALGRIRSDGEVRLWPFRHQPKQGGSSRFDKDTTWTWDDHDEHVLLRSGAPTSST
ncbi:MAG: metallophosphoesterase [Nannocystis sp.]|nr:metallophosphoesterase [Nannocystis sp.]